MGDRMVESVREVNIGVGLKGVQREGENMGEN